MNTTPHLDLQCILPKKRLEGAHYVWYICMEQNTLEHPFLLAAQLWDLCYEPVRRTAADFVDVRGAYPDQGKGDKWKIIKKKENNAWASMI
jgi:hypothetical protein